MKKKNIICLILAMIMFFSVVSQYPFNVEATNGVTRDTVLVLDESGSMSGTAIKTLKEASLKFCESVLNSKGTNRVAIVSYSNEQEVVSEFSSDINILENAINKMYASGGTNIYIALQSANTLLEESNAKVKNIVLMTDGLPNRGNTVSSGRYISQDSKQYQYANAIYNQAISYHSQRYIYTLGFFHSLTSNEKTFAARFLRDIQNAGYYEVNHVDELEFTFGEIAEEIVETKVTGDFAYPSDGKDYTATYYYADEYFYNDATVYNPSLATMSLCLAMSAFGSDATDSYENKSINVQNLLEELQFTEFETTQSFKEKPGTDSIAAVMAEKKVKDENGEIYTLLVLAVRGGGYEKEWASNFTLGNDVMHQGFDEAAKQVLDFMKLYINEKQVSGKTKLWVTGYSRAAATANLVAGYIDLDFSILGEQVDIKKKDLYAYCFETPAGTTEKGVNNNEHYNNIFNIINPNDVVTKVAPVKMGFSRYGVDYVLPTRENKYNEVSEKTEAMLEKYKALESTKEKKYVLDKFSYKKVNWNSVWPGGKEFIADAVVSQQQTMSSFLDDFMSKLVTNHMSREKYVSKIQEGAREVINIVYGDKKNIEVAIESFGEKIADIGTIVDIVWTAIWDIEKAEDKVIKLLVESLQEADIQDVDGIEKAAKPLLNTLILYAIDNNDDAVTLAYNINYFGSAHYPELCLAWMQSMDENYNTNASLAFSSGSYRIVHINCPVDVKVYDSKGTLVAEILEDESQEITNSSIASMINSDGEKILYLPADEEFNIDITATKNGQVSYGVNEFSYDVGQVNRLVNYFDIPIEEGDALHAVVPEYSEYYINNGTSEGTDTEYLLYDAKGTKISPDQDISGETAINAYFSVSAVSEDSEKGVVVGSGVRKSGNYAKVVAIANDGYSFEGWYQEGTKLSSEAEYKICVKEDIKLVAKFIEKKDKTVNSDASQLVWGAVGVLGVVALAGVIGLLTLVLGKKTRDEDDVPEANQDSEEWNEQEEAQNTEEKLMKVEPSISILTGPLAGAEIPIKSQEVIYLGKDPRNVNVVFSGDYPHISRVHCSVSYDEKYGTYFVTDSSTNGVYYSDMKKLEKGKRTAVNPGTILLLANYKAKIKLN